MAKIRGKKEGSIHQRPNGTWRVQISLDGRRLSFTGKTRRECRVWLKKMNGQIDQGMTFASTTVTLGEFLSVWLTSTKSSLRPSTWAHYEQLTRSYILPKLGQIKIKDLDPNQVQRFYNHLLASDVGTHTVIKIHAVLHSALEQAVKTGLAHHNPTDAVIPPSEPAREMQILDENQVSLLLLSARGSRMEALLHLTVSTGMGQMEILGLKWTDLDWIKKTLKVERQLVRGEVVQFNQPKTRHSRRMVVLGDRTIEVLRRHQALQNKERKRAGDSWNE